MVEPSEYIPGSRNRSIFVHLLRIEPPFDKTPYRIYVTDFTANIRVRPHLHPLIPQEFNLDPTQILQIDVYEERFEEFKQFYNKFKGNRENLFPIDRPINVDQLGIIAKLTFKVRMFNGGLEGRALQLRMVSENDRKEHAFAALKALCSHMKARPINHSSIPNTISSRSLLAISSFQPSQRLETYIHHRVNNQLMDGVYSQYPDSQLPNGSPNSSKSPKNSLPVISLDAQPKQENVGDYVPGNIYSDDIDDIDDSDDISEDLFVPNNASLQASSVSAQDSIRFRDSHQYTIPEICAMDQTVDNIIYPVNAVVKGIIPQDFSHICVKNYQFTNNLELSDPCLRPIQLILSNSDFLNNKNSIKVHFTVQKVKEMFDSPIELLYAKPEIIETKLLDLMKTETDYYIYKQQVKVGDSSIVVWCSK